MAFNFYIVSCHDAFTLALGQTESFLPNWPDARVRNAVKTTVSDLLGDANEALSDLDGLCGLCQDHLEADVSRRLVSSTRVRAVIHLKQAVGPERGVRMAAVVSLECYRAWEPETSQNCQNSSYSHNLKSNFWQSNQFY